MAGELFTDEEIQVLKTLVEMIIPASQEYGLPSAGDTAIFTDILATARSQQGDASAALSALNEASRDSQDKDFGALPLDQDVLEGVAETFRRRHPAEAGLLASITAQCYYRDDRVMRSLEMEVRPPYPLGYTLNQGDWSLLDPVRDRPEFFRKTP
jgi:hypothetical protein